LRADVQAFHAASLDPEPFAADVRRAVRPATAYARDRLLRRLATAEIARGVDPSALQSLADLVRPDRLKQGLRFFLARNDDAPNQQLADVSSLALSIAVQWVKAPDDQLAELRRWAHQFRRQRRGLTEKNRARLRQFANQEVIRNLVTLPDRLIAQARKQPVSSRSARKVQTAVALALLLIAPIRIGNLVRLDRSRHFQGAFSGKARILHLVIPTAEVKNDVDLEYPVPAEFETLVDAYLTTYQPHLTTGHPSGLLFPGRAGGPKHDTALRRQITDAIRAEAGLAMNPHLFRHLAALLFLEHHPGHYEEARRILGHKNINTTIQSYAGLETTAAVQRYDAMILDLRTPPDQPEARRPL
jgi:integrase